MTRTGGDVQSGGGYLPDGPCPMVRGSRPPARAAATGTGAAPAPEARARSAGEEKAMAYGRAERNLALVRQLEAETRQLLESLDQPDPEQSAWLQQVTSGGDDR
jgi:hypothetical protein